MSCIVVGPGLVGCYLGAAAGAAAAVAGPGGRPRAARAELPTGTSAFAPRLLPLAAAAAGGAPLLVATRVHRTPWSALPADCLAAQNGIGQAVPVAVCFLALDLRDGAVRATGAPPRLVVGRLAPSWRPVLASWRAAGIAVDEVDDIRPAQWEKAILNATVGPLCVATGAGMAAVWRDAGWRRLILEATAEGAAIAAAAGIAIAPGLAERAAAFFDRVGEHRPSAVADPGELPWILGPLRRMAPGPCPALDRIAALVDAAVRRG